MDARLEDSQNAVEDNREPSKIIDTTVEIVSLDGADESSSDGGVFVPTRSVEVGPSGLAPPAPRVATECSREQSPFCAISNAANLLNTPAVPSPPKSVRKDAPLPVDVPTKRTVGDVRPIVAREPGMVTLNVYNLTQLGMFKAFNEAMVPLASGGIFHVGVEVWQHEYSYGYTTSGPGIYRLLPRNDPDHDFRESISLGVTNFSKTEVYSFLRGLMTEWQGSDYHWAKKNCVNFGEALAQGLGVEPLPSWVGQFCRNADVLSTPLDRAVSGLNAIHASLESLTVGCKTCKPVVPNQRIASECCGKMIAGTERGFVNPHDVERRV